MSTSQLAPDDEGAMAGTGRTYPEIQNSAEFVELRRRFRSFVFPLTGLFLVWYFLYVLLAAFAPGFMGTKVFGNVNIGLLFGLGQFVSTFAITMFYARWADRTFDPAAEALRSRYESGVQPSGVPTGGVPASGVPASGVHEVTAQPTGVDEVGVTEGVSEGAAHEGGGHGVGGHEVGGHDSGVERGEAK